MLTLPTWAIVPFATITLKILGGSWKFERILDISVKWSDAPPSQLPKVQRYNGGVETRSDITWLDKCGHGSRRWWSSISGRWRLKGWSSKLKMREDEDRKDDRVSWKPVNTVYSYDVSVTVVGGWTLPIIFTCRDCPWYKREWQLRWIYRSFTIITQNFTKILR